MTQFFIGFALWVFLMLPPVVEIMESIMIVHMHMQMPMLVVSGFLMAKIIVKRFPSFFEKYNEKGIPGILLFTIIMLYWMLPRTMDEALTMFTVEIFKFISLPFLAGIPLRASWGKLPTLWKNGIIFLFTIVFLFMGWLYIQANEQLCNAYLVVDQMILGWGFMTTAICLAIYLAYALMVDPSKYE